MTRWRMRCVAIDGEVVFDRAYLFRRNAVEDAERLASPLYDVFVERTNGKGRPMLWPHTPPDQFMRQLRGS